jgi:HEPN domain-containing protein
MDSKEEAKYRLRLAGEHLADAREQSKIGLWSKVVLSAQLSVENSAKAAVACFRPVPKSHQLIDELRDLEAPDEVKEDIWELINITGKFGLKEHILTTYGDEIVYLTPREIYNKEKALSALNQAERGYELAKRILNSIQGSESTL